MLQDINRLREIARDIRAKLTNTAAELTGHRDAVREGVFDESFIIIPVAYLAFLMSRNDTDDVQALLEGTSLSEEARRTLTDNIGEITIKTARALAESHDTDELRELANVSFELAATHSGRRWDDSATPLSIVQLALSVLNPESTNSIADFGCGWATFLGAVWHAAPGSELYGIEASPIAAALAEVRLDLLGATCEIARGNVFRTGLDRNFDKVFAQLPFGMRTADLRLDGTRYESCATGKAPLGRAMSADWAFALRVCDSLREGGRAAIVMTNGATFNRSDERARRYFVSSGMIEAVIALPGNLFYSTGIQTSLVIFGSGAEGVRMVDATDLYVPGRRRATMGADEISEIVERLNQDGPMSATASPKEIAERGYVLAPHRYLWREIELENPTTLGEVSVAIERGVALPAGELDEIQTEADTGISYLPISSLTDGRVGTDLPCLTEISPRRERACLRNGDLVITKIGSPIKVAVAEIPEDRRVVATGNLYIVRLDTSRVDPYFAAAFLVSDKGRELASRRMTGTTVPTLSASELRELEIPLPPMDRQREVAERYQAALDEIEVLKIKMDKARAAAADAYDGVMEH